MFAKFKKNQAGETEAQAVVDSKRVPAHIAIIMDGNGRWANQRHLPRIAGHKEGMQTVKKNHYRCQSARS